MMSDRIYKIGAMLGVGEKDIRALKSNFCEPIKYTISTSNPVDNYKADGIKYGSISVKDFKWRS